MPAAAQSAQAVPTAQPAAASPQADGAKAAMAPVDLSEPAPVAEPDPVDVQLSYPERRCGFTFGLLPVALLGASTGYPNDALRIGRDEFYTNTGFVGGGAGQGWIGIAVADWLVFGVGGNYGRMLNADYGVEFGGAAFHVDAFPLLALGGVWQELGVSVEAGLSVAKTTELSTDRTVIDVGTGSRVGVGLFYEGFRVWQLSMGPYVGADTIFGQPATRPVAAIGWRTAFYAGPNVEPAKP